MGFLLLGVDSLIACIAIGPIMSRRLAACSALVVLFGVGDGGGFLLGSAFHWSVSDSLSNVLQTGILVALGVYDISTHENDLSFGPGSGGAQSAGHSGDRVAFMPFRRMREVHDVDVIGNGIPGLLRSDSHDGKKIEAALQRSDRVV